MGDKREFVAQMETAHGRQLRRFLSRRLRNAAVDVPDLIQEIYLRLLRIKDHEAVRNPQAYLYTVAGHVLHQHNLERSARAEAMDPLTIATQLETSESAGDLADDLEIRERLEDVRQGLEEFSPGRTRRSSCIAARDLRWSKSANAWASRMSWPENILSEPSPTATAGSRNGSNDAND